MKKLRFIFESKYQCFFHVSAAVATMILWAAEAT